MGVLFSNEVFMLIVYLKDMFDAEAGDVREVADHLAEVLILTEVAKKHVVPKNKGKSKELAPSE